MAGATLPLTNYLYYFFRQRGYSTIVYYDLLNHFTSPYDSTSLESFCKMVGVKSDAKNGIQSVHSSLTAANNGMPELTNRLLMQNQVPSVLIMDMVSRYIVGPDSISQDEVYAFASIQKSIANAREVRLPDGMRKRNIVVLITNKQNDLPAWFFLNNPTVKTLNIGYPSAEERRALLDDNNLPSFFASDIYQSQLGDFTPEDLEKLKNRFVARTEGFTNFEMANLRNLSRAQRTNMHELSIMDKFLQILEDGRMTDGQGHTVYFSECIIIFTSNLGITVTDEYGHREENVNMNMPYAEVQSRVRAAIEDHFKIKLGRPEILNRIGENVVVFDYIREQVAKSILNARLEKIRHNLLENKKIALQWDSCVNDELMQLAAGNLNNGGRGIMNIVEYVWINPLSRFMFDRKVLSDASIVVHHVLADHTPVELECEVN